MNSKDETLIQLRELLADGAELHDILGAVAQIARDCADEVKNKIGAGRARPDNDRALDTLAQLLDTAGACDSLAQLHDVESDGAPSVMAHLLASASTRELLDALRGRATARAAEIEVDEQCESDTSAQWRELCDAIDAIDDDDITGAA